MADVFSSLGLSSAKPDPSLYENQKAVMAQIDSAKSDVKSTLSSVNLAISTATLLGVPESSLGTLTGLKKQAEDLLSSTNLTPDQIDKKRAELDKQLSVAQVEQTANAAKEKIDTLQALLERVEAQYKRVNGDRTVGKDLIGEYEQLVLKTRESLNAAKTEALTVVTTASKKEGFQVNANPPPTAPIATTISLVSQTTPPPIQPTVAEMAAATAPPKPILMTASEIEYKLTTLNERLQDEQNKTTDIQRAIRTALRWSLIGFIGLSLFTAVILGGVLLSNSYAEEIFWGIRLYYFLYGMLLFPLPLLYGCFKPPFWYASIAPLLYIESPAVDEQGKSISLTFTQRLFGYRLYTPKDIETNPDIGKSRTILRILSILTSLSLAGLGIAYRFTGLGLTT